MSAALSFVTRACGRNVGFSWAAFIPIIMEALQIFLEQCDLDVSQFVKACSAPKASDARRLRRTIMQVMWDVRAEHKMGYFKCLAASFAMCEDVLEEARETAARVAGETELSEAFAELKQAA